MRKLDFWKSDWFPGVVAALILAVAASGDLIQSLERKAYDLGVKAASRTPSDKIVLIGSTAAGLGTTQVTPISAATRPVLTMAHTV